MKRIPLTKGKEALVDDQDYDYLMQWSWCFHKERKGGYAKRAVKKPRYKTIFMHTVVAARKGIVGQVDHCDQDKLNNQRGNLRPASQSQNCANMSRRRDNTSGYKGVYRDRENNKWKAQLRHKGRTVLQERFPSTTAGKVEAARAYNEVALQYFGEFAVLNPV